LRDDLAAFFLELLHLCKKKAGLLDQITSNEAQLQFFLHTERITEINDLIIADNDIFIQLDSVNFDIKSIIYRICVKCGIAAHKFSGIFIAREEEPFPELRQLFKKISDVESRLSKERDELISGMEKKLNDIRIDLDSIGRIRRLKHLSDFD
jgi:hypothetical protein